jgi:hypothetical protein
MARINAYPFDTTIADSDAWIGTKASNGATKQFTAADVLAYVNGAQNSGTIDTIGVFKTTRELYTPVNTTAITGKSFVQKISQTNATIELGATDTTFTTLTEGVKIYPNTTHYTTRVLPWLEVFSYENPAGFDNKYDANFAGASFIVGKNNTVGDATSKNLSILGINSTVRGDSSLVIGSGHTINAAAGVAPIVDSLIVGISHTTTGTNTRSVVFGTTNQLNGPTQNCFVAGSGNRVYENNHSFIAGGAGNDIGISGLSTSQANNNNFIGGGFSNKIGNIVGSTGNTSSFILGRSNTVQGTVGGAIGASNTVYSSTGGGNALAIGNQNVIGSAAQASNLRPRNAIAIGTANNVQADYTIHIGRGLDEVTTGGGEYVMIGRNNDQNTDYDLSALDVSLIVGASDQGAPADRRNAIVVTNKSSASNESNVILPGVGKYRNYASEALAIAGGVPLYGLYRNGDDVKIRITP